MLFSQSPWRADGSLGRFAALVVLGLVMVGCDKPAEVHTPARPHIDTLVVATPHNEIIRNVFAEAFSNWHKKHHGNYVQIRWIHAGTPQCVEYVRETGRPGSVPEGRAIPDVLFGGGVLSHRTIAEQGLSVPMAMADIEANLPLELKGTQARDPENRWHSSALSNFGILVARQATQQWGIDLPRSWVDLADQRFYGWIAIADPQRSGSNEQCLLTILQKYGWEKGWGIILRIAANCRALAQGSDEVINNVCSGSCLAGFCVNFNALRQIQQYGSDVLAYVTPADANAISPDVLSVLTYAQHPKIAERFARFCVSESGQKTWGFKAEFRDGQTKTLFHYPIDPNFYVEHRDKLSVPDNPFEMDSILAVDQELQNRQAVAMGPLLLAACGSNHVALQRCWRKIIASGMNEAALAELLKPIVTEARAYEMGKKYQKGGEAADAVLSEWSKLFSEKYERVNGML